MQHTKLWVSMYIYMIDKLRTHFTLKVISKAFSTCTFGVHLHTLLFTMFSKALATSSTERLSSDTLFSLPNSAEKREGERRSLILVLLGELKPCFVFPQGLSQCHS